jgi:hypothetical protein
VKFQHHIADWREDIQRLRHPRAEQFVSVNRSQDSAVIAPRDNAIDLKNTKLCSCFPPVAGEIACNGKSRHDKIQSRHFYLVGTGTSELSLNRESVRQS